MSDILFNCPECGHSLAVDSAGAGMLVPCPECQKQITIPAASPPPHPPSAHNMASRAMEIPSKMNRLPIIGLILGILGLWFMGLLAAIPAVICAHIGKARALKSPTGQDKGLASAGLVVGYLAIAISLFMGSCGLVGGKMGGDDSYDRMKTATMRAWQGLQAADNQIRNTTFSTVSSRLSQTAYLYSVVDLSDVDPILQRHFQDCISTTKSAAQLAAEVESKYAAVPNSTEDAAYAGAMLGAAAGDGYDPQGDAAAGALVLGFFGALAQQADYDTLAERYDPEWKKMFLRLQAMDEADKKVAAELTRKYGVPFTDPF